MLEYLKEFGLKITLDKLWCKLFKNDKVYLKRHQDIKKYLFREEIEVINKYKDYQYEDEAIPQVVYVFWYQGVENAPLLIKKTIASIKAKSNMEVIVIDKDNFSKYTDIDKVILDKLANQKITYTFFFDVLRFNLLKNHGGYWLDSTIFMSDTFNYEKGFFTIKNPTSSKRFVSEGRWSGFAIGGNKHNPLFNFVNDFFIAYLSKHDLLIDYFLVDYAISLAYDYLPKVKEMIDKVNTSNENLYELMEHINDTYSLEKYNSLTANTIFHKLSYKNYIDLEKKDSFYYMLVNDRLGKQ